MKWKLSLLLIIFLTFFKAQDTISEVLTYRDVTYKKADTAEQKLDIYLPENSMISHPVVIYAHGGGWNKGDKAFRDGYYLNDFVLKLVQDGYAVVSINYTLLDENTHFPKPVEDYKEAVRWIRANASKYNFDRDNIGIWGASAGAQIGLIAANSAENEFSENTALPGYSSKVNYFVDFFGPTDLNQLFRTQEAGFKIFVFKLILPKIYKMRNDMIFGITSADIKKQEEKAIDQLKVFSPVTYTNQNSVPTLIIHGTKDKVVPYSQSELLKEALDKNGVVNELVPIDKGNHGLNEDAGHEIMLQKMLKFIKENTH
jgi:acetyl esterase/lipase